jgi:hypothetical protein
MLWLVLLACLRAVSLSQAQVPWQTSLAAFAFIRLFTAVPITPGGLGITELGLIGILADGAGHKAGAQITAAVLMYRAVTYLPSIPLGAIACLIWRHAPALIYAKPAAAGQLADVRPPGPDLALRMGPGEATTQRDGGAGNDPPARITPRRPEMVSRAWSDRSARGLPQGEGDDERPAGLGR